MAIASAHADHGPAAREGALGDRLGRILEGDDVSVMRLRSANTSIAFRVQGGEAVTLLLDRRPPALAPGGDHAEIEVFLDGAQAEQFGEGLLNLPLAVYSGEAGYRGPIRKYLTIDAVLRTLLRRQAAGG